MTEPSQAEVLEQRVLATWGLREPPFADLATDAFFFPGEQHIRALDFMRHVLCSRSTAGVLTGDPGSGKSMLVRSFLAGLDDRVLVAHVQRADLEPREFLNEILQQFGLLLGQDDRTDRRLLLNRYLTHQVGSGRMCLLIIENAQRMKPAVLEELRWIGLLESDGARAVKLLLLGESTLHRVIGSPKLQEVVRNDTPRMHINGLSEDQLAAYVAHRLRVSGATDADRVVPAACVPLLTRLSRGAPGAVNRLCAKALCVAAQGGEVTVTTQSILLAATQLGFDTSFTSPGTSSAGDSGKSEDAMLLVSVNGGVDNVVNLKSQRILIGRSEFADVQINSAFVSHYHAVLVREPNQDLLIDLGSTNGVLVNTQRISRRLLRHRDLIQIGPARISYLNPGQLVPTAADASETISFARPGAVNASPDNERTLFAFGRFDDAG
ncbi:MAG: AAA family ATPase [Steroidobacter sp.]